MARFAWSLLLVATVAHGTLFAQELAPRRIAFISERDGNVEIYVVGTDEAGLKNITNDPEGDWFPSWSPDGSRIAYRHGLNRIMVVNADGSNPVLLATSKGDNPEFDLSPEWSPDGSRIVFDTESGEGRDIFVIEADGSDPTNLTHDGFDDSRPRWSPDGSTILFESHHRAEGDGLYRMNADGTGITFLAAGHGASWSPDGSRIAFTVAGAETPWNIFVMKADGSDPRNLTHGEGGLLATLPTWSPDGSRIAFQSLREGDEGYALYVMSAEGSSMVKLSGSLTLYPDMQGWMPPAWSPDGSMLAVTATESAPDSEEPDFDVYVISADGTTLRRLASHPAVDGDPIWSPLAD